MNRNFDKRIKELEKSMGEDYWLPPVDSVAFQWTHLLFPVIAKSAEGMPRYQMDRVLALDPGEYENPELLIEAQELIRRELAKGGKNV